MKRELNITTISGKVYLYPVPVIKERKYLVLCASEEVAKKVASEVMHGKLTHPDLISEDFVFLTYHTDKQTKIFTPNPALKFPS